MSPSLLRETEISPKHCMGRASTFTKYLFRIKCAAVVRKFQEKNRITQHGVQQGAKKRQKPVRRLCRTQQGIFYCVN